jgi:hypothetical protein
LPAPVTVNQSGLSRTGSRATSAAMPTRREAG